MIIAHQLRRRLAGPFTRSPFNVQRLRWPNPFSPPYRQKEINLARPGELGDVVMSLAVVRAIRERNPTAFITFVTHYHELLKGHPLLDRVMSPAQAAQAGLRNLIALRYEVFIPLRLHIIDYLAGCVGLRQIPHEIPLPDFSAELGAWAALIPSDRPRIVICRAAGPFTPNKTWPDDRWDALISRLTAHGTVIELGANAPAQPSHNGQIDGRGHTTVRQFCALIAQADLLISALTGSVHIAAAYRVPTVSVLGGYELPVNTAYPLHTALYRGVACSPCWLRAACPISRECLRQISVEDVLTAALQQLATRAART
ncbi:MAG: hypothetical protein RL077_2786 [Verrucomicrobiota bacterium]|jgi:ADP-heptose:LPS heptosyltransferase